MAKWVPYPYRVPRGYGYCRGTAACVPQAYPFLPPKKISRYGLGRVRYGLDTGGTKTKPNGVVSTRSLLLSLLSQAEPLDSLSHFLTLPATGDGRCSDCGLAAMKTAPIIIWRYVFLISLLNMKIRGKQNPKANIFFFVLQCFWYWEAWEEISFFFFFEERKR